MNLLLDSKLNRGKYPIWVWWASASFWNNSAHGKVVASTSWIEVANFYLLYFFCDCKTKFRRSLSSFSLAATLYYMISRMYWAFLKRVLVGKDVKSPSKSWTSSPCLTSSLGSRSSLTSSISMYWVEDSTIRTSLLISWMGSSSVETLFGGSS